MPLNSSDLVSAVRVLQSEAGTTDQIWLQETSPCLDVNEQQFVAFLKPDATDISNGVKLDDVLDVLDRLFAQYQIDVSAVRVVSGGFFTRTRIMEKHYGVINEISRTGLSGLTASARDQLEVDFGEQLGRGDEVVGGHQFLAEYPEFSPLALSVLFDNLGSTRLAPGTYCCGLNVEGRNILLLNGFHPRQLERFTRAAATTVIIEGRTKTPWSILRKQVVGATDPRKAVQGSFRRTLLERMEELGLPEVSQNANGLHLSAGPLEGMVELRRFLLGETESGGYSTTCFGQALAGKGLSEADISALARNPTFVVKERVVSAYDLTEEVDAVEAAEMLCNCLR